MTWAVWAGLAAAFAALVAVFGKVGLTGADATVATAARAVVMAAITVAAVAALGKLGEAGRIAPRAWIFIVLSGAAGAASWICYFLALKNAPSTTAVAAIDRASVVLVFVLAVAFLGEAFTWKAALGAALCAGGAVLLSL
jgi:transporter family protein